MTIKAEFKNNIIKLYYNEQFFYALSIEKGAKVKENSLNEIVKNLMECIQTNEPEIIKEVIYRALKDTLKENGLYKFKKLNPRFIIGKEKYYNLATIELEKLEKKGLDIRKTRLFFKNSLYGLKAVKETNLSKYPI